MSLGFKLVWSFLISLGLIYGHCDQSLPESAPFDQFWLRLCILKALTISLGKYIRFWCEGPKNRLNPRFPVADGKKNPFGLGML